MKICFIGPANSAHIEKWCNWFTSRGHEVHVVSFTEGHPENTYVHFIDLGVDADGGDAGKLKYLLSGRKIRHIVNEIKPDVINVHYATSYGSASALSGMRGYILSVWGSDVYEFPQKSPVHKALLKFSLKRADKLFSTSKAMANEAGKYTKKSFAVTPFGVDLELFDPKKRTRSENDGKFVIGTVKGLSDNYGIRDILEAAAILKKKGIPLQVRIAGRGTKEAEYKKLASDLGIEDIVEWLGFISQEQAAKEWADMDVAVIPSVHESFGVAAVEAQACGTPVIISDIPGLMEAAKPGKSAFVVHKEASGEIADALIRLYEDKKLRIRMGAEGRLYVEQNYELNKCFEKIEKLYRDFIR